MKNNTLKNIIIGTALISLLGCSGAYPTRPDAKKGVVTVGQINSTELANVQREIEEILASSGHQTITQRQARWKRLLNSYQSKYGDFELAILTAMAMDQLAEDQRNSFFHTVAEVRKRINEDTPLSAETEMVLALADALKIKNKAENKTDYSKGRVSRAVESVLNAY